ncbi:MOSC domain-containing protein [Microbulbifer sp. MKSA007]|uniref:MOSC domain-containing protein n=1 Tax=unclassified Microbulbifer TaxID=2619833 RepID=UPI002B27CAAE|nr:MOSC domain-containing protein [Microbulbifer sp. MKSA007]
MKLLSINVSKKVDCEYRGKTVTTGIFKKPVQGKLFVGKNNLEGDEQADLKNHGGKDMAIYAFSNDHYPYWEDLLGRKSLKYGAFGENLTVEGLREQNIFVGDQFRIGSCILEVSQPRIPCFKLSMALDNDAAAKILTSSFNCGVYFRVIKEGHIKEGDSICKIAEAPNSIDIRSMFRAFFDKQFPDTKQVLQAASQLQPLSKEWREKAVRRLSKL